MADWYSPGSPSNGEEGGYFESRWCSSCHREQWNPDSDKGRQCPILTGMYIGEKRPEYQIRFVDKAVPSYNGETIALQVVRVMEQRCLGWTPKPGPKCSLSERAIRDQPTLFSVAP